jgi:DNA-binding NarL/FixJ family response regulator
MTLHSGLVIARPGLVRDGLQAVLSAVPEMQALEPAGCAASALERLESHTPCVTILDSSLSEEELCATLGAIKEKRPQVWCIVIASSPLRSRVLQTAGADAVLVEGFAAPLLSTMIKEVIKEQDEPNRDRTRTES